MNYQQQNTNLMTVNSRFYQILGNNYTWQKCQDLASLIQDSNARELQPIFPALVANLFGDANQGYASGTSVWSLRDSKSDISHDTLECIYSFLCSKGPVFNLIYKLMADPSLRYECTSFGILDPMSLAQNIQDMPAFLASKMERSPKTNQIAIALNPLEYYLYHFIQYAKSPSTSWNSLSPWLGTECLYLILLEDYLSYFFPLDGSEVPSMPYGIGSSVTSLTGVQYEHKLDQSGIYNQSNYTSPVTVRSPNSLLRAGAIRYNYESTPSNLNSSANSQVHHDFHETWRSEYVLNAIVELWLCSYIRHPGVLGPGQIAGVHRQLSVPSVDLIRVIRVFIKHMHYFANTAGPELITSIDTLKPIVILRTKMPLYSFLKKCFCHWPMDSSLSKLIELWLSFVQPWRYVGFNSQSSDNSFSGEKAGRAIADKTWSSFVENHLLFYTELSRIALSLFLRMDLTLGQNSHMLARIGKVLSQGVLPQMIQAAEKKLSDCSRSFVQSSSRLGEFGGHPADAFIGTVKMTQCLAELEGPEFEYVPLFSVETINLVSRVLLSASNARQVLDSRQQQKQNSKSNATTSSVTKFLSGLHSWFLMDDSPVSRNGYESGAARATADLNMGIKYLSEMFKIPEPVSRSPMEHQKRDVIDNGFNRSTTVGDDHSSMTHQPVERSAVDSDERYKWEVINGLRKPNIKYQGNPDEVVIRSGEWVFLVRLLHRISQGINHKFADDFLHLYHNPGILGKFSRQLLCRPTTYVVNNKSYDSDGSNFSTHLLPPRLRLRFLAQKKLSLYLAIVWLLCFAFNQSFSAVVAYFLLACFIFVSCRALLETVGEWSVSSTARSLRNFRSAANSSNVSQ